MVDDPVQAMDPAKVDGLARTLADHSRDRQVVVFSHDDRLASAVRRMEIDATILQVTRMRQSAVTVRQIADPVDVYLDDARSVAHEEELTDTVRRDLVVTLCRNAFDALAVRSVQTTKLGTGATHAEVEALLNKHGATRDRIAVALFGEADRRNDVEGHFRARPWVREVLRACMRGGHGGDGPTDRASLLTFVERAEELIGQLR
ncbi:hypothetical protein [Pseudonocardia sp. HH130630-07]|uniref:hypothetical protein n=1 Tax=Pseudonocardia sp. HH130630-07 TaxID=1690815 RepID=UPI0012EADEFF|nr:hypothetical protein [Pseudonocardia sp. HH130630-07]